MTRRQRLGLIAVVPIVALIGLALLFGGRPSRSALLGDDDESGVVDQYRIVYEVTDASGTYRRELQVDRPFIARVVEREGPERDDAIAREQITALGFHAEREGDGEWTLVRRDPVLALGDTRLDRARTDLLAYDLVREVGRTRVADTSCRRYQTTGSPVDEGTVGLPDAAARSYSEVCVTDEGVVLASERVVDGRAVERVEATRVELGTSLAASTFRLPEVDALTLVEGGGAFEGVDPDAALNVDQAWTLTPPSEWELQGRWATVPATGRPVSDPSTLPLSIADVWLRGADTLLMIQGPAPVDDRPVVSDEIETPVGTAQLIVGARLTELRIPQADGQTVRLLGTLSADELRDLAEDIEVVPVVFDEQGEDDGADN